MTKHYMLVLLRIDIESGSGDNFIIKYKTFYTMLYLELT